MRNPSKPTMLIAAAALLAAACAGAPGASPSASDVPTVAPETSAPASVEPSASASASAAAGAAALEVVATEYAFAMPQTVAAGPTEITVRNDGQEDHQAQVARLNTGVTIDQFNAELQNPDPSAALGLVTLVGGPTGVAPGESVTTGSDLEPGPHVFLCFLSGEDGVPHLAKGQIAVLEVTEPAADGALPEGEMELTLQDFAFVGVDTLTAGQHTLTVTNDGPQPHEATIVKLADGVTVDALRGMFTATEPPPDGPPPFTSAGGIAGIAADMTATLDVDLEAGEYAWICFIPDPATGKAHAALGMIGGLTVQ